MSFPNFDYCIICDGLRPELGGKVTILGFFGIAPNVDMAVANSAQPLAVSFLAGFAAVRETNVPYEYTIVVSRPNGTVTFQTPPTQLKVSPVGRGIVGTSFMITPPYPPGRYSIRIMVNNETKLDTYFTVRQATSAELGGIGIPPLGRPN